MINLKLRYHDVCPLCGNARIACGAPSGKWYLFCVYNRCIESTPRIYKSFQDLYNKNDCGVVIERSLLVDVVKRECKTCGADYSIRQLIRDIVEPENPSYQYYCANPECDKFYEFQDGEPGELIHPEIKEGSLVSIMRVSHEDLNLLGLKCYVMRRDGNKLDLEWDGGGDVSRYHGMWVDNVRLVSNNE